MRKSSASLSPNSEAEIAARGRIFLLVCVCVCGVCVCVCVCVCMCEHHQRASSFRKVTTDMAGGGVRRHLPPQTFFREFINIKYSIMLHALLHIRNYRTC